MKILQTDELIRLFGQRWQFFTSFPHKNRMSNRQSPISTEVCRSECPYWRQCDPSPTRVALRLPTGFEFRQCINTCAAYCYQEPTLTCSPLRSFHSFVLTSYLICCLDSGFSSVWPSTNLRIISLMKPALGLRSHYSACSWMLRGVGRHRIWQSLWMYHDAQISWKIARRHNVGSRE